MIRCLFVEDESLFVDAARDFLAQDSVEVVHAATTAEGKRLLQSMELDIVILDARLPDGSGFDLLPLIPPELPILVVTAYPAIDDALSALRRGIREFLLKPVKLEALRMAILRADEENKARRHRLASHRDHRVSPPSQESQRWIEVAKSSTAPVLLTGETGTGKSHLARAIHEASGREGPFVSIGCAALPDTLLEAELFGTLEGAFTGAKRRTGLIQLSHHGTLFLDELGTMSLASQAKLLEVLETKQVRALGATEARPVDMRIIAATNADLPRMCEEGTFRPDLMFRLAVLPIELQPLRERQQEIAGLVETFLKELAPGRSLSLADGELTRLSEYRWPGNIRELRGCLERATLVDSGPVLSPSRWLLVGLNDMTSRVGEPMKNAAAKAPVLTTLAEAEDSLIVHTLRHFEGHKAQTATALGIGIATLRRKLHRLRDAGRLDE